MTAANAGDPGSGAGVDSRPGAARLFGRRWLHLVLGGALLMPFFLLTAVLVGIVAPGTSSFNGQLIRQLVAYALALPLVLTAGFVLPIRGLMDTAARGLLGPPYRDTAQSSADAPGARGRLALWFLLHLALGGLVAGLCLAMVPLALVLLAKPFARGSARINTLPWVHAVPIAWTVPAGLALLAGVFVLCWGGGRLLAALAPRLLGPSPTEALALERARVARLARRNRLARDLHDSVGHSLSVVTLQAGAARRVLDQDPQFARDALEAIESAARDALTELDWMLGILRGERDEAKIAAGGPAEATPDLRAATALIERTEAAGVPVEFTFTGTSLEDVPRGASREAFRILQEGLGNAARHAGPGIVRAHVRIAADVVEIEVVNPLPNRSVLLRREVGERRGGRGLVGIRERAAALGGECSAGPEGERWRLWARLPYAGMAEGEHQAPERKRT